MSPFQECGLLDAREHDGGERVRRTLCEGCAPLALLNHALAKPGRLSEMGWIVRRLKGRDEPDEVCPEVKQIHPINSFSICLGRTSSPVLILVRGKFEAGSWCGS
jgi:hypothetical protein